MTDSKGRINIAIDGLSACGKSTLAKDLANELDYIHIDSGSMYRAITYYLIENHVNHSNTISLKRSLDCIDLKFILNDGKTQLFLNGVPQNKNLRLQEVDQNVSQVAAIEIVRDKVIWQQRQIGENKGVVMDGRDIGSVIFPEAKLKIFLQADLSVRVNRRLAELHAKGIERSENDVVTNLQQRDQIDATRAHSPLIKTRDAVLVDNSNLTVTEQVAMILALAKSRINQAS